MWVWGTSPTSLPGACSHPLSLTHSLSYRLLGIVPGTSCSHSVVPTTRRRCFYPLKKEEEAETQRVGDCPGSASGAAPEPGSEVRTSDTGLGFILQWYAVSSSLFLSSSFSLFQLILSGLGVPPAFLPWMEAEKVLSWPNSSPEPAQFSPCKVLVSLSLKWARRTRCVPGSCQSQGSTT